MPLSFLASLLLLGQAPTPPAVPPPAPAAQPAAVAPAQAPAPAPAPPAATAAPAKPMPPRVDKKKPYMRVWYWPPSPTAPDGSSNVTVTDASGTRTVTLGGDKIDPIHFPTNRWKVVDEHEALGRLAAWMKANPSVKVTLDGYADARGSKAKNEKLAANRAKAVRDWLVNAGVPADRVDLASHGSDHPVKGETAEETYWLSRRVSIRFEGKAPEAKAASAPVPDDKARPVADSKVKPVPAAPAPAPEAKVKE